MKRKGLPHNWETEKAVLGGLLLDAGQLPEVRSLLQPQAFHRPSHQALYRLILDLDAHGTTPDATTVYDAMEARGLAEEVGGYAYVAALPQACASVDNISTYAARVAEYAHQRRLVIAVRAAEERTQNGELLGEVLPQLEEALRNLGTDATTAGNARSRARLDACHVSSVVEHLEHLVAPARGLPGVARFPWPGTRVDRRQSFESSIPQGHLLPHSHQEDRAGTAWETTASQVGQLVAGTLAVLVGATGRGKSAFALQIAHGAAMSGAPVLYVSVEMGADELVARLLALRASNGGCAGGQDVAWSSILLGGAPFDDLHFAGQVLVADCPALYLWAPGPEARNVRAVQEMARAVSMAHGGAAPFVVLDYVQRLAPPGSEERRLAVGDASAGLRDLSRAGMPMGHAWPGAAVLALSSTARGSYEQLGSCETLRDAAIGRKADTNKGDKQGSIPPKELVGLGKESGELEYDAPLVLVFTTDPAPDDPTLRRAPRRGLLAVAKNRLHGGRAVIDYIFSPASGRFTETSGSVATIERIRL